MAEFQRDANNRLSEYAQNAVAVRLADVPNAIWLLHLRAAVVSTDESYLQLDEHNSRHNARCFFQQCAFVTARSCRSHIGPRSPFGKNRIAS